MKKHTNIPILGMLTKTGAALRSNNPEDSNLLTDMDILKSFDLPVMNDEHLYKNSSVARLLRERENRPSKSLWSKFMKTADDCGLSANDAADLYFHLLSKDNRQEHNPMMPSDEAPPNVGGSAIDGLGLSADGRKDDEDCD